MGMTKQTYKMTRQHVNIKKLIGKIDKTPVVVINWLYFFLLKHSHKLTYKH